ncbi:spore protease YyaC [Thermincola potens]|uniref:Sporulation protein YyaC n=1 Tax=Thermincola potens (strain JR) TaxID=635013 RepID=D5XDS6_THEPJ|nr:spore protease YyaC [Thermincola potens]ADG83822.1 sporulation protein YyaC [Thermincola potens JR]
MSLLKPFFNSNNRALSSRIHMEDPEGSKKISDYLNSCFAEIPGFSERPKVVVCIGSDRSTGDSLGPLVGTNLLRKKDHPFQVMGSLESPVHASNLAEYLKILETMNNPVIMAVDACLGNLDSVGFINIGQGSLKPGAGVNKCLPAVGDLHITGIVNVGGFMEYFVLQNTRLNTVMKMAELISEGLVMSCRNTLA